MYSSTRLGKGGKPQTSEIGRSRVRPTERRLYIVPHNITSDNVIIGTYWFRWSYKMRGAEHKENKNAVKHCSSTN